MSHKITVRAEIETPRLPNFFRMSDGQSLPVHAVSEESLREIGRIWTEELVAHAKKKTARANPTKQ